MKKVYGLFMLLVMCGVSVFAQSTLTVADGSALDSWVPIRWSNGTSYQHTQVVYDDALLTNMVGTSIYQLQYYACKGTASGGITGTMTPGTTGQALVMMGTTTDGTQISSSFFAVSGFDSVYSGTIEITGSGFVLTLDQAFYYTGGDLVVDFAIAGGSDCGVWNDKFIGESQTHSVSRYSSASTFLPKTTFSYTSGAITCDHVTNLATTAVGQNSAILAWNTHGESSWSVYLDSIFAGTATDSSYTLTGLTPNTEYTAGVVAHCSAGDSSVMQPLLFRTACGPVSLPYSYGFEDVGSLGNWPNCWTRCLTRVDSTSSPALVFPAVYSTYVHSGSYSVKLNPLNGGMLMFASPAIAVRGDQLNVSFYLYIRDLTSVSSWVDAGVMSNPEDTSTFIPLLHITNTDGTWGEYEFSTEGLDSSATYCVAWKAYSTSGYYDMGALDDVTVTWNNGCERPQLAVVDSTTLYEAYLRWGLSGDNVSAYDIFYNTENDYNTAMLAVSNLEDTAYVLTDLQPDTRYYAWVRAACGTDSAEVKTFGTFTTQVTCAQLLNATLTDVNYAAASFGWQYNMSHGFPSTGVEITISDLTDSDEADIVEVVYGTNAVISGLNPSHQYRAVLRNVCEVAIGAIDTASAVVIDFETLMCTEYGGQAGNGTATTQNAPLNSYYRYGFTEILYKSSQMPAGVTTIGGIAFQSSSAIANDFTFDVYMGHTVQNALNAQSPIPTTAMTKVAEGRTLASGTPAGWHEITLSIPFEYDNDSNLVVVIDNNSPESTFGHVDWLYQSTDPNPQILYKGNDGNDINPANPGTQTAINGIFNTRFYNVCEAPTCFSPMTWLGEVTSSSITVEWSTTGSEFSFVCQYQVEGAATWTDAGVESGYSFTFTGLGPNTLYELRIGSICDEDTLWSELSARTLCTEMTLPGTYTFTGTDYTVPDCWTVSYGYTLGSRSYPSIYSNALHFVSYWDSVVVASPAIPLDGNNIMVSYQARSYGDFDIYYFKAGVMTDPANPTTFIPLLEQIPDDEYDIYEFNTSSLDANQTYYLAFCYFGYQYLSNVDVDNVTIMMYDGCSRVTDLTVDSTSLNAIYLHWTPVGEASSDVVVSYTYPGAAGWTTVSPSDGSSHTITGAVAATTYTIRVGVVCTADTLWRETTASTQCNPFDVTEESPLYENFDDYMGDAMPACWLFDEEYNSLVAGGLQFGRNSHRVAHAVVLPRMNAPLNSLMLNFRGKLTPCDGIAVGAANAVADSIVWLDTLQIDGQSQSDFRDYEYNFQNVTVGPGFDRIALRTVNTGSCPNVTSPWALIDDVEVSVASSCLRPTDLEGHDFDDETATYFTWTDAANHGVFEVVCDTVTANVDDIEVDAVRIYATDYMIPAGTIVRGGKYTFYVRSVCPDGSVSTWRSLTFACGEAIMPAAGRIDTVEGCGFVVYDNGGPYGAYTVNSTSTLVIMPASEAERVVVTAANFNMRNATLYIIDGDSIAGDTLYSYTGNGTPYSFTEADTVIVAEAGPLTLHFVAGSTLSSGFEVFVGCIAATGCIRPQNLSVAATSPTTAEASWSGTADSYSLYYRETGAAWTEMVVNATSATLTGLSPQTTYELYVRSHCGEDVSEPTTTVAFVTPSNEGIEGGYESGMWHIYPNPASSLVTIDAPGASRVEVVDMNGRVVYNSLDSHCAVDVSAFAKGAYFVRIVGENNSYISKLIVK